jgi:hypothetical protein
MKELLLLPLLLFIEKLLNIILEWGVIGWCGVTYISKSGRDGVGEGI